MTLKQAVLERRDAMPPLVAAAATMTVGMLARVLLRSPMDEVLPLLLLAATVTAGAWIGGLTAGLLATGFALGTAAYYFIPPLYSFRVGGGMGWVQLVVFASQAVAISWLGESRRRLRQRLTLMTDQWNFAQREAALKVQESRRTIASLARASFDLDHTYGALVLDWNRHNAQGVLPGQRKLARFQKTGRRSTLPVGICICRSNTSYQ